MTNATVVTSSVVSAELLDAFRKTVDVLRAVEKTDDERGVQVVRQLTLITALIPLALYLEQVGEKFELEDLADLNSLDSLIARVTAAEGMAFAHASIEITKFLVNKVPLYKGTSRGQQDVWAARFYARVMNSVGWSGQAIGETRPASFDTSYEAASLDLAID